MKEHRGCPPAFVCNNRPLNQQGYTLLRGPGKALSEPQGTEVSLVYDYAQMFKNSCSNWIMEAMQQLPFNFKGK